MKRTQKLAILGLGHVGSAVLMQAVALHIAPEIVCIDVKDGVAHGEALDMMHALSTDLYPGMHVSSGTWEDLADADVIICAAGPSILPGVSHER
ncbi:lactate/malate family dehydrogenase, partial [Selenomonas sp.]|nr:L-lactate dehydrogenase [Selenomonas sp.]MDY4416806.1 L-lactate dehydrogenase [Selenomonas sp.]